MRRCSSDASKSTKQSPRRGAFGFLVAKTLSHLVFAFELKYIPEALYKELEGEGEEIAKMLNGYISCLKKSKQGANEPGANRAVREQPASYLPSLSKTTKLVKILLSNSLIL